MRPGTSEPSRLIRLRRPPQISMMDGRFVPSSVGLDAVDAAWQRLLKRLPRAFDGPVLHVTGTSRNGHGGVVVHCMEASYRFHAVAGEGVETGIRPLGVRGICTAADGRVLMARRGAQTLNYAGEWEFAPGGAVEPGMAPADALLKELREETGWRAASAPIARALAYDPVVRTWEIIFAVAVHPPEVPVQGWECSELALAAPGEWPQPLCAIAAQIAPLARSAARAD